MTTCAVVAPDDSSKFRRHSPALRDGHWVLSIAALGAGWDGGGDAGGHAAFDGGDCTVRADRGRPGLGGERHADIVVRL